MSAASLDPVITRWDAITGVRLRGTRLQRSWRSPTTNAGLVPVIVQDWHSGEVLTLAYANEEAVRRTRESGELHLYSRSRSEQWHKGATSGNTQAVRALRLDCDGDALLALVEPAGPACHTGERTCFHHGELEPPAPHEALAILDRTLVERDAERPAGLLHDDSCSRTRRSRGRRCSRRPRRSPAPRARRPTSASTTRPPTSSTTSPSCCAAAGAR